MKSHILIVAALLLTVNGLSQDTLKVGEVYDFEIGDEFHYRWHYSSPQIDQKEKVVVEDKWYSDTQDTVFYYTQVHKKGGAYSGTVWDDTTYVTTYHTNLDEIVPAEYFFTNTCLTQDTCALSLSFEPQLLVSGEDCGHASVTTIHDTNLTQNLGIYGWSNGETYSYSEGLGVVYYNESSVDDYLPYNQGKTLEYYKKGSIECGERVFTGIETIVNENMYTLSPIPVIDVLSIDFNSSSHFSSQIKIIDLLGKVKLTKSVSENRMDIDLSDFTSGTYFIVHYLDGIAYSDRFVKL